MIQMSVFFSPVLEVKYSTIDSVLHTVPELTLQTVIVLFTIFYGLVFPTTPRRDV